jgi:hypothetical protein
MTAETIPGFSALAFKDEVQEHIHRETKDMTVEERIRYFHEAAETGPFADRWRQLPEAATARPANVSEHNLTPA